MKSNSVVMKCADGSEVEVETDCTIMPGDMLVANPDGTVGKREIGFAIREVIGVAVYNPRIFVKEGFLHVHDEVEIEPAEAQAMGLC